MLGCVVEKGTGPASKADPTPVLFSIEGDTTYADEFIYVYQKNNVSNDSAFTEKDVSDYLILYENFKLKVHEARQRGMDTSQSYLNEMKAYEQQLKKPYLTETQVTEELVKEAYERFSREIRASHILIRLPENASPQDTLEAYQRLATLRDRAIQGEDFAGLAAEHSDDPSGTQNGGDLQYFTSLQMVYPFETAAYTTPVDSISTIIRTQFGYHILKVQDKRPSNNKLVASHIMIRHDKEDSARSRNLIFEVYDQASGGVDWSQLVNQYSEDLNSKRVDGRLQAFGIRQMPFEFQEAAFSLSPGEISDPIKTDFGWHIIRLEQRIPLPSFEKMETMIRERVENDVRADLGEQALLKRLRREWNVEEYASETNFSLNTDSTLSTNIFKIGDSIYTQAGLKQFSDKTIQNPSAGGIKIYQEYLNQSLLAYEEAHLEEKYVDYRMLLREYREGILLFQLMEEEIWTPASNDSIALAEYFKKNREKYRVAEQIEGTLYPLYGKTSNDSIYSLLTENAQEALDELIMQYEKQQIVVPVEISQTRSGLGISEQEEIAEGKFIMTSQGLLKVTKLSGGNIPELQSVRGKVIADFQGFLEKQWIGQLKERYNVQSNEKGLSYVYKTLVR